MISNETLLDSKAFKTNNTFNIIIFGIFFICLLIPYPFGDGIPPFLLTYFVSFLYIFNFYKLFFMPSSGGWIYTKDFIIIESLNFTLLAVSSIFVIIFFIYNIRILKKTKLKKDVYKRYLYFSIIQVIFCATLLFCGLLRNLQLDYIRPEHYNTEVIYGGGISNVIIGIVMIVLATVQLSHYIIAITKLKTAKITKT